MQLETNHVGDVAEQAVILKALQRNWGVSRPIGNSLPYDLVIDVEGELRKIQVKSAWLDETSGNYLIDCRRTKTNRRKMLRSRYESNDFDFAIVFIPPVNVFYVLPIRDFLAYKSTITFVEKEKRQRKPQSHKFREAWHLLESNELETHD
jgi:hypothetical protein